MLQWVGLNERGDFSGCLDLLGDNKRGKDVAGFVPNGFLVPVIGQELLADYPFDTN